MSAQLDDDRMTGISLVPRLNSLLERLGMRLDGNRINDTDFNFSCVIVLLR